MGASLTERRRVRDEGLRVVNRRRSGGNSKGFSPWIDLYSEEGRAKYVPAAAVIRRWLALLGIIGCKGQVGGLVSGG